MSSGISTPPVSLSILDGLGKSSWDERICATMVVAREKSKEVAWIAAKAIFSRSVLGGRVDGVCRRRRWVSQVSKLVMGFPAASTRSAS